MRHNDLPGNRVDPHYGRAALHFILLIGVLSFFADFTYEGSRSIAGLFLGIMGHMRKIDRELGEIGSIATSQHDQT